MVDSFRQKRPGSECWRNPHRLASVFGQCNWNQGCWPGKHWGCCPRVRRKFIFVTCPSWTVTGHRIVESPRKKTRQRLRKKCTFSWANVHTIYFLPVSCESYSCPIFIKSLSLKNIFSSLFFYILIAEMAFAFSEVCWPGLFFPIFFQLSRLKFQSHHMLTK